MIITWCIQTGPEQEQRPHCEAAGGGWGGGGVQVDLKTRLRRIWFLVFKSQGPGSSCCGSEVTNLTSIHEDVGSILGLSQGVKDLALLWLWCRLAIAAPI